MTAPVPLTCLVFGLLTQVSAVLTPTQEGAPGEVPEGAAALVNGRPVAEDRFRDWLLQTHGWAYLDDFVALELMRHEAARLGLEITDADVEAALQQDWKDNVLMRYGGDEARFLDSLKADGLDREGYLARKRFGMEQEVLARRIVKARRDPTAEDLQALFAEEFPGGRRQHVQVAFFDVFKSLYPIRSPQQGLLERTRAATRARAEAFLAAVRAAPDSFAGRLLTETDPALVSRHDSFVNDLREVGGDVPRHRKGLLAGDPLSDLLARTDLEAGEFYGPIESPGGYYVVRLVAAVPVTFEEVQDELRDLYRTRPATPREVHYLRNALIEQARVQKAPQYNVH